ncbi:SH3 domain-containing protein [Streptomyces sp. NPDC048297]|uniref:SH3 domain-containing protein n=1 Tax=Streptomyces sp. NPDC048297 TaxID=3365531 RepID=UPI0037205B30
MSLRPALPRGLALAAVTGALLSSMVVVPATAADGGGDDTPDIGQQATGGQNEVHGGRGDRDPRRYRGVVTAHGGIWLHDRPDRGSLRVRFAAEGETVTIYCKAGSATVAGNPLWYLLTDGTWAWGSARYIQNVGPAPRWC